MAKERLAELQAVDAIENAQGVRSAPVPQKPASTVQTLKGAIELLLQCPSFPALWFVESCHEYIHRIRFPSSVSQRPTFQIDQATMEHMAMRLQPGLLRLAQASIRHPLHVNVRKRHEGWEVECLPTALIHNETTPLHCALEVQRHLELAWVDVKPVTWINNAKLVNHGLFARRDIKQGTRFTGPYQGTYFSLDAAGVDGKTSSVQHCLQSRHYVAQLDDTKRFVDNSVFGPWQYTVNNDTLLGQAQDGSPKKWMLICPWPWNLSRYANHARQETNENNVRMDLVDGTLIAARDILAGTELRFEYSSAFTAF